MYTLLSILLTFQLVSSYSFNLPVFKMPPMVLKVNNPFMKDLSETPQYTFGNGYDERNITDKNFDYKNLHEMGVKLKNLQKVKSPFLHPVENQKNNLCPTDIKMGGLFDDFNESSIL